MDELKECPFCNSNNLKIQIFNDNLYDVDYAIACYNCTSMGGFADSEYKAKLLWNLRGGK